MKTRAVAVASKMPETSTGQPLSKAERQREEAKVAIAIQQAAQAAKAQGKLPGSLARLVDELVHPILDWREILRTFIDHTARNDYSWIHPNRRHIAGGIYLPSFRSNGLKPLVLAVDTSGSIGQSDLNQFQAELNDILLKLSGYRTCRVLRQPDIRYPYRYLGRIPRGTES